MERGTDDPSSAGKAPRIRPRMRQGNDPVLCQVGGLHDARMRRQIAGRRHDDPANLADVMRDKRGIGQVRDAQGQVHPLVDQVHRPFQHVHAHGDGRIFIHEGIDDRPENLHPGEHGRGNHQRAARYRPLAGSLPVRLVHIGQNLPAGLRVALPRLAQLDGSGGPVQQRHAHTIFQKGHGPAHRGGGATGLATGTGEAAFIERRDEDFHGIQTVHSACLADSQSTVMRRGSI